MDIYKKIKKLFNFKEKEKLTTPLNILNITNGKENFRLTYDINKQCYMSNVGLFTYAIRVFKKGNEARLLAEVYYNKIIVFRNVVLDFTEITEDLNKSIFESFKYQSQFDKSLLEKITVFAKRHSLIFEQCVLIYYNSNKLFTQFKDLKTAREIKVIGDDLYRSSDYNKTLFNLNPNDFYSEENSNIINNKIFQFKDDVISAHLITSSLSSGVKSIHQIRFAQKNSFDFCLIEDQIKKEIVLKVYKNRISDEPIDEQYIMDNKAYYEQSLEHKEIKLEGTEEDIYYFNANGIDYKLDIEYYESILKPIMERIIIAYFTNEKYQEKIFGEVLEIPLADEQIDTVRLLNY